MTAKNKQRRETDNDEIQGSFDCVWRKSAPDSAQDDGEKQATAGSFGFAQDRLFDCVTHDETVSHSAQDDNFVMCARCGQEPMKRA